MRRLLAVLAVLDFLVGFELFFLDEHTPRTFAWTVHPALTGAVLGVAYWTGALVTVGAALQRRWVAARIALPGAFVVSALTLVATLLHLSTLHLQGPETVARLIAWAWLLVACSLPPLLLLVLVWQLGAPGDVPPPVGPLPPWLRYLSGTHAVAFLIAGGGLFIVPDLADPLWPWPLSGLSGQILGAWLLAMGLTALLVAAQNDWPRARVATNAYTPLGLLLLVALVRYHTAVNWSSDVTWLIVVAAVTFILAGAASLRLARRY
jgi:hypothetical protein